MEYRNSLLWITSTIHPKYLPIRRSLKSTMERLRLMHSSSNRLSLNLPTCKYRKKFWIMLLYLNLGYSTINRRADKSKEVVNRQIRLRLIRGLTLTTKAKIKQSLQIAALARRDNTETPLVLMADQQGFRATTIWVTRLTRVKEEIWVMETNFRMKLTPLTSARSR